MVRIQDKRKANLSGKVLNIYSDVTQNTFARDILKRIANGITDFKTGLTTFARDILKRIANGEPMTII